MNKKCHKCNLEKSTTEFSLCRSNTDGLQNKCKACSRVASRDYAAANVEKERDKKAKWYLQNRDKVLNKAKQWNFANRGRINARKYKRYHKDPNFKLADILRSRVAKFLKNGSAYEDLGCTLEELRRHLESKFKPGMTWENHTRDGWHIDHVKPLVSFNLMDRAQFKQAAHYTNLQPLWAAENSSKRSKI